MKNIAIHNNNHQYLETLLYGDEHGNITSLHQNKLSRTYQLLMKQHSEINETERDLAILFLDIRNFTELLDSRSEREILKMIGMLFTIFNKIITHFGGRVIERAGDNLYAVFGLAGSLKDAANHAYQSARTMFDALGILNENYFNEVYGYPLEIGIGLHTGHVYIGQFEFENYASMTVMGLPVNIAARLQTETKTQNNDFIVSEDAFQYLEAENEYLKKAINLRGISRSFQVRLVGKPFSQIAIEGRHEQELASLLAIAG